MSAVDKLINKIDESFKDLGYVPNTYFLWDDVSNLLECCFVPSLSSPYDDLSKNTDKEYATFAEACYKKLIDADKILSILNNKDLQYPLNPQFVSSLVILVEQINAEGLWSDLYMNNYSENIVKWFENRCDIYKCTDEDYKCNVFQICMKKFHTHLTQDKWKHYPALMDSYRCVVRNMTEVGKIKCPMHVAFPATLMQIEDFNIENKLEGLICCSTLLENLIFTKSGYEDVLYDSLRKLLMFQDTLILKDLLYCILILLRILIVDPDNIQWTKRDDVFEAMLNNIVMENDMVRKNIYFELLPDYIDFASNGVIRWKTKILNVACNGIDIYLNQQLNHENLNLSVKCILAWIKIGWPVWSYSSDHSVLIRLFGLLCLCCDDEKVRQNVHLDILEQCILTILSLYTESQRREVFDHADSSVGELGENFITLWTLLKQKVLLNVEPEISLSDKIAALKI